MTALLASLGWRLAQAQEQGWHAVEKVRVYDLDKCLEFVIQSRQQSLDKGTNGAG